MIRTLFQRGCEQLSLVLCMSALSGAASASGFALIEQSASGLGNAFAAGAAATDDASVQYFNPAAMTELSGTRISVTGHLIMPSAKLDDGQATVVTLGNIPVTGTVDEAGENGLVPNFYYIRNLDAQTKFGLGINAPFGLSTEYDKTWIGRYHAIRSEVMTVNINPALAYEVNDRLSLGVGLDAQYIKAELSSAVDSGSICYAQVLSLGGDPASSCDPLNLTPGNQSVDSYATVKGDDWSYGYNLGLLFKPADGTRLGFAYRAKVKQNLTGDASFVNSPAFAAFLNAGSSTLFSNTTVSAGIELPASAALSIAQQLTPELEMLGDVTWTQWSSFKELRITYAGTGQPDSVTSEDWNDTLRYAIGLSYKLDDRIKLRSGIAYDQAAVPDPQHRTPRIPDNGRTWLALGMSYASNDNLGFDIGYAHLFIHDAAIDNTTEASIRHNLQGSYRLSIDIISAQLNYRF